MEQDGVVVVDRESIEATIASCWGQGDAIGWAPQARRHGRSHDPSFAPVDHHRNHKLPSSSHWPVSQFYNRSASHILTHSPNLQIKSASHVRTGIASWENHGLENLRAARLQAGEILPSATNVIEFQDANDIVPVPVASGINETESSMVAEENFRSPVAAL